MNIGNEIAKAYGYGYEQGIKDATQWISVKDRLPKDDELVLVVEEGQIIIAIYDAILDSFFEDVDGPALLIDIEVHPTHWMYLPEPPKGE